MRDETLRRWVEQPPASPNVQYLRDAERLAAWEQLGSRRRVLDLASEANVTAGLDAERVARVDFSPAAGERAREVLGDAVDRYEETDPGDPTLPFDDDAFDGGVCIGPYDWRFLDVDALTAEVGRVVAPDGLFVFSVPTPRSPYALHGRNRFRYYTPDEALSVISPDWRLDDYDLLYQFPPYPHTAVNYLPDRLQEPFVALERRLSSRLTAADRWEDASYLVLGTSPLDYGGYLDDALDCLFRPTAENGFWDEHGEKFVRALDYRFGDDGVEWSRDDRVLWRYAPFALMGAMEWRASARGDDRYDGKLRRELDYFAERVADRDRLEGMPSYGIGPLIAAFAVAADVYDEPNRAETARSLFEHSREAFEFDHAEDSLVLYGWTFLYELAGGAEGGDGADGASGGGAADRGTGVGGGAATDGGRAAGADAVREAVDADAVGEAVHEGLRSVIERYRPETGLFVFDNGTTRRHQNQMYTLWGLCRAIEVTGERGYLGVAKAVLDYTVGERMRDDGAFIWEDVGAVRRLWNEGWKRATGRRPPHWDFLYECHQTFFANAVACYYAAGGDRTYDTEIRKAMAWIYGENEFGTDLVGLSGLGVPVRFVTVDGRADVAGQQFKGAYEVGSYVMALTNLLAGPLAPRRRERR